MPAIYHFTDICNLERILADRELRAHRSADCVVDIGDETIKSRRMRVVVTCGPGGKVCDYVPFYFAPRSPMLFRIQRDGVDGVSSDPARLVYFVSSTDAVPNAGAQVRVHERQRRDGTHRLPRRAGPRSSTGR